MRPLRLILIRHGETKGPKGVLYSQEDVPLSERGLWQSRRLVEALKEVPLEAVYASDLKRASLPARLLAEERKVPLYLSSRWREIDFGRWAGLSFRELMRIPEFWLRLREPARIAPPGGESLADLRDRALQAVEEIRARHPQGTVAVFTHGGLIRVLILYALGSGLNNFFRLEQDYAAVNLVDFYPEGPVVRLVNAPFELNLKLVLERESLL